MLTCLVLRQMTEMSPEEESNALPKALVKNEEEGVANAAGKDEQPKPRNYKWLAAFFMSIAFVSILANGGLAIAKTVGLAPLHGDFDAHATNKRRLGDRRRVSSCTPWSCPLHPKCASWKKKLEKGSWKKKCVRGKTCKKGKRGCKKICHRAKKYAKYACEFALEWKPWP